MVSPLTSVLVIVDVVGSIRQAQKVHSFSLLAADRSKRKLMRRYKRPIILDVRPHTWRVETEWCSYTYKNSLDLWGDL